MFSYLQIKYFCAIYRHGNLSKAADELYMTRQALGKSLSQLEKELGGPLFLRQSDGVQPTELARQLYPKAVRLCEDSERIFDEMRSIAQSSKIPLHIGSTFSALETTLPLLPITFAREHPNIELSISELPDLKVEELVSSGGLDGGLVLGPATPQPGIVAFCVHREKLGMLMREDNPLARHASIGASDLRDAPLLLVSADFKASRQLEDRIVSCGVKPTVAYSSGDFALLVKMTQMGQGITPLPVSRSELYSALGLVTVPLDDELDPGWQIDFIWRDPISRDEKQDANHKEHGQGEVPYALAAFMECLGIHPR